MLEVLPARRRLVNGIERAAVVLKTPPVAAASSSGSWQFRCQLPALGRPPARACTKQQAVRTETIRVTVLLVHRGRPIVIIIIIIAILNHPGCCNVSSSGGCNETEDELVAAETGARLLRFRPQKLWTRLCLRNLKTILSLLLLVTRMC